MSVNLNLSPMLDSARYAADQSVLKVPDTDSKLREAAEQFEAIFLNEFLKQARKAKLAEDIFASSAKETCIEFCRLPELDEALRNEPQYHLAEGLLLVIAELVLIVQ